MTAPKRWWVRWYHIQGTMGDFACCSPFWCTGSTMDEPEQRIMCAALKARDEEHVKEIVYGFYDERPESIEISFIESRPDDWDPLENKGGRFPPGEWMKAYWDREEYRQEE